MNNSFLENIRTFLKVVEVGGFLAAARELNIAQSTASRRISELERQLDSKLIERTTRRLMLTEAGKQYAEAVRLPLQALVEAGVNIKNDNAGMQGPLRVSIPSGFGRSQILPSLASFAQRYPMIRLDIDLSDRYVDLLTDDYDFAVRLNEPVTTGIQIKPLNKLEKIHLCATPRYLQDNPIHSPKDLLGANCLVANTYAPRTLWTLLFGGTTHNVNIRPHMILSSVEALYDMTLEGIGVAILPDFLIQHDLTSGKLELASSEIRLTSLRYCLAWPSHKSKLIRIQALRTHIERELSSLLE